MSTIRAEIFEGDVIIKSNAALSVNIIGNSSPVERSGCHFSCSGEAAQQDGSSGGREAVPLMRLYQSFRSLLLHHGRIEQGGSLHLLAVLLLICCFPLVTFFLPLYILFFLQLTRKRKKGTWNDLGLCILLLLPLSPH